MELCVVIGAASWTPPEQQATPITVHNSVFFFFFIEHYKFNV